VRVYGPAVQHGVGSAPSAAFLGSAHILCGELIADRLLSPIEVAGQQQPT
jgi:tRNA pseudouridine55 synthase